MTLITSNCYKSHIQSQLRDFADDSLSTISKFVVSYEESRTWDEWANYFENKDLDTLSLRESGILLMLCARMQQSLLNKVSDSSFSWSNISLEEELFHLRCVLELQEYLYENSKKSTYKKIAYNFVILLLCNTFWSNFFHKVKKYNELCHEYIQTVLKANYEYIENNIAEDKENALLQVEIWENEILEEACQAREIVRSGKFKRQTLDEFKASLFSDDEE